MWPCRVLTAERGVEVLVFDDTILHRALSHQGLARVARLLEHAAGGRVAREGNGEDTDEIVFREADRRDEADRVRRDPAPPELLADPVAELGGLTLDVLTATRLNSVWGIYPSPRAALEALRS